MRIAYLSLAVQDLAEIRTYLASTYPSIAQQAGSKLRASITRLTQFPNLGKPGRVFGTRELVIPQVGKLSYIARYRVQQERIQILRVLAGMRDIDTILEEGIED